MANIENLNFQVILDDSAFQERINKDIADAQRLTDSLDKILRMRINSKPIVTAAGVKNAQEMSKYLDQISQKIQSMPRGSLFVGDADQLNATLAQINATLQQMGQNQKKYTGEVQRTNNTLYSAARMLRTLSTLTGAAFSVAGLRRFISSLVRITGEFEVQRMALRNMLQDVEAADKIFDDLYKFSSESTYRFSELAKYAKQLSGFQIGKDDLLETTKMLGDVASGLGISMDRLILAYGHVKSSGFLRGIQLRSFSQNGVPILKELSDMFTEIEGKAVSMGDVFDKMTKREISFEMVEEAFRRMTSEGRQFYQMQEVLAKTLAGQINILKGRWENMLAAVGKANDGFLKGVVATLNDLVLNYEKLGKLIGEVAIVYGVYKVATIAAMVATGNLAAVMNLKMVQALKNVAKWMLTNPWAILAAEATIAVIEIAKAIKAHNAAVESAKKSVNDFHKEVDVEKAKISDLIQEMRNAGAETEQYGKLKEDLLRSYGHYLSEVDKEKIAIGDLAGIYDTLAASVENAARQRFLMSGTEDIDTAYYDRLKKVSENSQFIFNRDYSDQVKQELSDYIFLRKELNELSEETQEIIRKDNRWLSAGSLGRNTNIDDQRRAAEEALRDRERAKKILRDTFGDLTGGGEGGGNGADNTTQTLEGWRKIVQDLKDTMGDQLKSGFLPKDEEDYFQYIKRIKEEYEELGEQRERALSDGKDELINKSAFEGDIKAIEELNKALEGNILKETKKNGGSGGSSKKPKLDPITETVNKILEQTEEDIDKELLRMLDANTRALEKRLDRREKVAKEYADFFKEWSDTDFGKRGEGALFKVTSALTEYRNKDEKVDDKYYKGLALAQELHRGNAVAIAKEAIALKKLRDAEKAMNQAEFREKIRGLADDIFKEQMKGFDLSDWNDKTLSQINAIRNAVGKVEIPPEILKELEGDTEAAEALARALNELKADTLQNTVEPERFKKVANEAKRISGYLGNAAEKMKALAEASGGTKLGDVAEVVGMLAQNMQAAADGAESWGGWWGAIIGGITDIFDQMVTGLTDAISATRELKKIVREIKTDSFILSNSSMFSNDSIFGENQTKNMRGAVDAMKNLRESMVALGDPEVSRRMSFWEKTLGFSLRMVYKNAQTTADEFAKGGKLSEVMSKYGLNVYDEYDNFDPASIREVIKLFGDEDGMLEKLAKDAEAYAEAMKVVDEIAESIVGGIVSDITDKIVDSWWEAGRAALDYADILEDVAKSYAKLIVRDMLLDAAFDEQRQDAFKKALTSGDARKAMAIVEEAMQSAQDMLPAVESALQAFEPYRNLGGGDESNSVGSGIKNITEDTANLLASYINAIRADVSYMRGLQERSLEGVAALSGNIPTLNDYLAQCAANTYDVAQSNQSILSEIRSVIGAPGTSGMVVRVESY